MQRVKRKQCSEVKDEDGEAEVNITSKRQMTKMSDCHRLAVPDYTAGSSSKSSEQGAYAWACIRHYRAIRSTLFAALRNSNPRPVAVIANGTFDRMVSTAELLGQVDYASHVKPYTHRYTVFIRRVQRGVVGRDTPRVWVNEWTLTGPRGQMPDGDTSLISQELLQLQLNLKPTSSQLDASGKYVLYEYAFPVCLYAWKS